LHDFYSAYFIFFYPAFFSRPLSFFLLSNRFVRPPSQPLATGEYRNAANAERTFIMLKPDAVQRGLIGAVIERFESRSGPEKLSELFVY
jgi:hypothetical protein